MHWLWAGIAIVAGFILGSFASRIVRSAMARHAKLAPLSSAGASLAFSLLLVAGLLVSLGIVRSESLDQLRDDTISYLPRALSALIVVILGGVVGTIVSTAVRESVGRTMGRLGEQIPGAIKGIISAFAAILAASQLGIDTTVINIAVAGAVFGIALAFSLIVGMGSRPVATEIASGRALRRLIEPGDTIVVADQASKVVALHPTVVEVDSGGARTMMPNSSIIDQAFTVERAGEEAENAE